MTVTWPPPGPVAPQTPTLEGNALEASDYAIRFGENTPRTTGAWPSEASDAHIPPVAGFTQQGPIANNPHAL